MEALDLDSRIYVAGHRGLVGSAIVRALRERNFDHVLTAGRTELDLRKQADVDDWFARHRPEIVIVAAGTVGGIEANASRPGEFIYDNLMIQTNVVHAAFTYETRRLLYLGSSCIYPRECPQPMGEASLYSGPLEPTSEAYAVAKIAGIRLCQSYREQYGCRFISAIPANLYGPGDNFDPSGGHVMASLIRRFHEAKGSGREVTVWGSGRPVREFFYVDDLADAALFLLETYDEPGPINVGTGRGVSIAELADLVRTIVDPGLGVAFDRTKPDGAPAKVLDSRRLHALGWRHHTSLRDGVEATYHWFTERILRSELAPSHVDPER